MAHYHGGMSLVPDGARWWCNAPLTYDIYDNLDLHLRASIGGANVFACN